MKVYVKYDKNEPHLPVAVADSKEQLARKLGVTRSVVYSSFSHKRSTYAEVEIEDTDEEEYIHCRLPRKA